MTNGMKSGAGSDPFADEDAGDESDASGSQSEPSPTESHSSDPFNDGAEEARSADTEPGPDAETLPYIFQRDGVKDDRSMIQYFLREEAASLEDDVQQAVEEEMGTDVYLTDVREAMVHVAAEHSDEVTDVLREWGYRFKE